MQHAVAMLMHDALSHMAMSRFQIAGDYYTLSSKDQFYYTIINIKHDHYKSLRKVDKEQKEKKRKEKKKKSYTTLPLHRSHPPRDIYAGHSHVELSAKREKNKEFSNNAASQFKKSKEKKNALR